MIVSEVVVKTNPPCQHAVSMPVMIIDQIQLFACTDCRQVFRLSTEADKHPAELYDDYYSGAQAPGRFSWLPEIIVRIFRFYRAGKIHFIAPKATSALDIGCGRGLTLYYLRKYFGFTRVAGTQIASAARQYAEQSLNLEVHGIDLLEDEWRGERFDLITMWHVLEHVLEPELYVRKIRTLLKPEGKLLIEVPNFNSWTRRFTGPYWLGLDLKYHLTFFTPESLKLLLERNGFTIRFMHAFSFEYSTFISVQSIISWVTHTDQVLFYWFQRPTLSFRIIPHLVLLLLMTPICFVVNLVLFFSSYGEVLLVMAEPRRA